MKFIITVDTEADNQWKQGQSLSLNNIAFLQRFQTLCQKFEFRPTYLLTYEVATDPTSVSLLSGWQKDSLAEIGSHLHPWTTPPIAQYEKDKQMFPSDLEDVDFQSKLAVLTGQITESFGQKPTSYRAGRWGFKRSHSQILAKFGYTADCSISPRTNWGEVKDKLSGFFGPDFRHYSANPFYFSEGILEVPVTVVYTGIFGASPILTKWFSSLPENIIKKILNKIFFQKKWLRIFPESQKDDWIKIYKMAVKTNLPVLEFMIHSSELMAGGSPYAKDEQAVERIYKNLEEMFSFFHSSGLISQTLQEFSSDFAKLNRK